MSAAPETVAVVPVRDGVSGKSRLATALGPAARRRLVATLARHVVGVLVASDAVDRVAVVTADAPFAAETLAGLDVGVVVQPADRPGLDAALDLGREHAAALGARRVLVAHADLPLLSPADVAALLAADASVVVAPDRHGTGTNLLLVPATPGFTFRFGPGSCAAHVAEAGRAGLPVAVVHRPGTEVDLDTLDDWGELPAAARDRLRDGVGLPLP
ncbi:2-phospho-L-lactate guanylyltransferase [Isoptericola cucumis]|uniref:Phosphoenolpyruvate guanylyltransferase n=1 Tax=Isoptericola cucumis TaxID=1776856 RepID=A0ABQ2B374_9MICO|nr:2-phospho-L-lactate guanylyltransferase [Isoptericola cucumis]GGI05439.1 2-phospho-L-lactate guanylyltransferase [Isoptericola cucumis]